jgi:hypothetical protein
MILTSLPLSRAYLMALPRRKISLLPSMGANASWCMMTKSASSACAHELGQFPLHFLPEDPFTIQYGVRLKTQQHGVLGLRRKKNHSRDSVAMVRVLVAA